MARSYQRHTRGSLVQCAGQCSGLLLVDASVRQLKRTTHKCCNIGGCTHADSSVSDFPRVTESGLYAAARAVFVALLVAPAGGWRTNGCTKRPAGGLEEGIGQGPSPPSPIRVNCLNLNQKKCKFLLCCRGCQAPLPIFFFPLFFSLRAVAHGEHFSLIKTRTSTLMSRYGH